MVEGLPRQVFDDVVSPAKGGLNDLDLSRAHWIDAGLQEKIGAEGLTYDPIELGAGLGMAERFPHAGLNRIAQTIKILFRDVANVDRKQHVEPIDTFFLGLQPPTKPGPHRLVSGKALLVGRRNNKYIHNGVFAYRITDGLIPFR